MINVRDTLQVGGAGYLLRRLLVLVTAASACAAPLPMPENTLATAVLVAGSRAYRVDALAENPWLVRPGPMYLLEYADEVDALPWPEEPVEISFDETSTVALAPMPDRWRRSDGEDWPESAGCDVDCDPWAPSRWTTRGLALRPCPQLRVMDTSTSQGERAARWDDERVLQPEPNALVRLVGFGKPDRESRSIDESIYPSAVRLGDTNGLVWRRSARRINYVNERSFTAGVVGPVSLTVQGDLVDIVEPVEGIRAKRWLVTSALNAPFRIYEMDGRALNVWDMLVEVASGSRVFASDHGYVVVGPDDSVTIEGGRPTSVAPVARISLVAQIEGVGLLAAGRYTDKDEFSTAVLLRYDVASASWRPYAALPGVSSVVTMVPHEGGVLFGGKEGVGYYSRTTGACTIAATLPDVTQLIAMPDGTHYVRAANGFESTVGWLVP